MFLRKNALQICLLLITSATASSQPLVVEIPSLKDNTLYEDSSGAFSNGAGYYFFAGRSSQATNSIRRGVIKFDVYGSIPPGAVILDAELELYMSRTSFGPTTVEVHRLLTAWGEGISDAPGEEGGGDIATTDDATWLHAYYDTALWSTPGGDFNVSTSTSSLVDSVGFYTFPSTSELVSDVQEWYVNPGQNFGWILLGDESTGGTSKRFDSRENPLAVNRPVLRVTYAIPSQLAIEPIKDNTLYQSVTGALSNGAGSYFFVGKTFQLSDNLRRGLIAFDVFGSVPAGSIIVGAELNLNMSKTISGAFAVNAHKVLADWGEGTSDAGGNEGGGAPSAFNDATWDHTFYDFGYWATDGGDYQAAPSASISVTGVGLYVLGPDSALTADVVDWYNNPGANYGWILIGDELTGGSAKRFDSRENSLVSNRPQLTVFYFPPPCCIGIRGDINDDGIDANILDLTYLVDRIFRGGPIPSCLIESDLNSDGTPANILDLTYLVDRIFRGGPTPGPC
jgi:hypothetical protein